jgi:hypothetical protein
MQGKKSNDPLDSVLHKLDYTFIDLPDLIDGENRALTALNAEFNSTFSSALRRYRMLAAAADDEAPEPETVYTQSVYAFDASRAHTAQEQQQQQQGTSTAVSGSYWQQLQQFSEAQPPNLQQPGTAPGILGSSLAQAVQQQYQQFGQQQQLQQQQQVMQQQQALQQQQPSWGWQQPHGPATPPVGR